MRGLPRMSLKLVAGTLLMFPAACEDGDDDSALDDDSHVDDDSFADDVLVRGRAGRREPMNHPRPVLLLVLIPMAALLPGCKTIHPAATATAIPPAGTVEGKGVDITLMGQLFLDDVDGRSRSLGELLGGKATLISFWATYCGPCKQKIEDHQALHDRYAADGLTIVAVSVDEPETVGQVRTFVSQRRITLPVLLDRDCQLIEQLNPRRTLPFSLLIDGEGRMVWTHEGYAPGDRELFEQVVQQALGVEVDP